jgi:hypothetical protein
LKKSSHIYNRFSYSPNGWTDSELALAWMIDDFDTQTKEKAAGRTRVLLLDGHNSHYTIPILEYAWANNITILGYPPHCTHVLQGLDVVCFAKMKNEFRSEIQKFENLHRHNVTKADFAGVFGQGILACIYRGYRQGSIQGYRGPPLQS